MKLKINKLLLLGISLETESLRMEIRLGVLGFWG